MRGESAGTCTQTPRRPHTGCAQTAHPGTRPGCRDDVTAHQRAPGHRGGRRAGASMRQPFGINSISITAAARCHCPAEEPRRRCHRCRPPRGGSTPEPRLHHEDVRDLAAMRVRGQGLCGEPADRARQPAPDPLGQVIGPLGLRPGCGGGCRREESGDGGPWRWTGTWLRVHFVPRRRGNQPGRSVEIRCFIVVCCLPG